MDNTKYAYITYMVECERLADLGLLPMSQTSPALYPQDNMRNIEFMPLWYENSRFPEDE